MKWKDMIAMAFGNLFKRKVRTLLTVSGVVIGTCAIVVMLSFGIGMKQSMETMMENMGDLTVINVYAESKGKDSVALDDKTLEKIKAFEHVVALTPVYQLDMSSVTIKSGKYNYVGMIYGVNMDSLKDLEYHAEAGELPGKEPDKATILFGKDAAYDFMDSHKKNNNMVNPTPDKNGNLPKPFVDPLAAKLEVTVNLPENSTAKVKPTDVLPVDLLIAAGEKNVLAVDVGKEYVPPKSDNLFEVSTHSLGIMSIRLKGYHSHGEKLLLEPTLPEKAGLLTMDQMQECMEAGYNVVRTHMSFIRSLFR